ncbi:hypothetical protein ACFY1P_20695 [Streptomyces sp. NPDC001407]|uniref:hypothetical protein n=1 Tax=Streptomyces sp. NPDC001407 TaxID=3364573 RepID=UPI003674DBD8
MLLLFGLLEGEAEAAALGSPRERRFELGGRADGAGGTQGSCVETGPGGGPGTRTVLDSMNGRLQRARPSGRAATRVQPAA